MIQNTLTRVVVVGNGMVGYKFCEKLIAKLGDSRNRFELVVFGEEPRPAYDRVHLSDFLLANLPTTSRWRRCRGTPKTTSPSTFLTL